MLEGLSKELISSKETDKALKYICGPHGYIIPLGRNVLPLCKLTGKIVCEQPCCVTRRGFQMMLTLLLLNKLTEKIACEQPSCG